MNKTALLVIDVQDSFKAFPKHWAKRNNLKFEANISKLIAAFEANNQPIFYVLHSDPDEAFLLTSPHYKLMDFLDAKDKPILEKTTRSVFASTDLQTRLNKMHCNHIVITGIQTEQCCETTTRHGADLGYTVDYVSEATLTFPIKHWAGGKDLMPAEIVERTEYALAGRFASIKTVAQVIDELDDLTK